MDAKPETTVTIQHGRIWLYGCNDDDLSIPIAEWKAVRGEIDALVGAGEVKE